MHSYPLDLATMFYLLQGQSGRLQVTLEELPGSKEPCRAMVVLLDGKVTACFIETRRGVLISQGAQALSLLVGLGTLDWLWQPDSPPAVQLPAGHVTNPFSSIPRRREPFRQEALWNCSRIQRRVLGLVDGRRTIQEIATLLAVPPAELERLRMVLHELRAIGLILLDE